MQSRSRAFGIAKHAVISLCFAGLILPLAALAANGPGTLGPPGFNPPPGAPFPQGPNFAPQAQRGPGASPPAAAPQAPANAPNVANPGGLGAIGGAIAGGIGGALIGLVVWLLRKTAKTPIKIDPATGGIVAEYAPGLRYMMYGFSAFTPTVLIIIAIFMPPQHQGGLAVVGVIILLFVALGGSVSWGLARARAIATDQGISSSSGWRRRRSMQWSEVSEVSFLKSDASLLFKSSKNGARPIKVGILMAGLKPFTERMRKHLPPERYAKAEEALKRIDQLEGGEALPFGGLGATPVGKAKPAAST